MLGSPILYLKGMRVLMFQLSGFYYRGLGFRGKGKDRTNLPRFKRSPIEAHCYRRQ